MSPDRMSQSMRINARRLMALSVVKERNPELYAIRVEELRLQLELRALGEQWRAATEAKDEPKAAALAATIKDEPWHYLYVGEAMSTAYAQLKSGGWYGDVFLLQKAITLGFPRIVLET